MRHFNRVMKILLIITILFPTALTSVGATSNQSFHYVALGDSLTVGLEPQHYFDQNALRYGFTDRVYEQALFYGKTSYKNYGVNGLTSTGLKNFIEAVAEEKIKSRSEIQGSLRDVRIDNFLINKEMVKADIERADLITITIGGNDFGARTYIDIHDLNDEELLLFLTEKLAVYKQNIEETLSYIYKLNPNVTVVLTDQYNPFPRLNQQMYKKLTFLSSQFTLILTEVIHNFSKEKYEIKLAPISQNFINREINLTHILRADIHPNQKGYDEMAKIISEILWGVYYEAPKKNSPISITVKGKELNTPFKPVLLNGSNFVPIREYAESLGATVTWDHSTRSATVQLENSVVSFKVGSSIILVDGKEVKLQDPVQLINSKLYVPLRAIAEALNFEVTYIKETNRAFIH